MCDVDDIDFEEDTSWGSSKSTSRNGRNHNVTASQDQENDNRDLNEEHIEVLSRCFGHSRFRQLQWKIIRSIIIDKKDVCAIMATGYGKSLCYQFPSVFSGGVTIVISPLISLMEDQVLSLKMSNIPACLLGSAQTQQAKVLKEILSNYYRIVYATPEFCTGDSGMHFLERVNRTLKVDLLAIDEAHCVSQWGHDFRVKYRRLSDVRKVLCNVPVLAVTATATQDVKQDIIQSLKLKNPNTFCSGFDRPNLFFEVVLRKHSEAIDNIKPFMVRDMNGLRFDGSTIIYCLTKKQTEEVAKNLSFNRVKCLPYHASLSMGERKNTHEMFAKDQIKVIIATIAFGMGIDKPDVRNVIHYGCSKDIESYYQEVGRAGRDGLPAKCILLHSSADFHTHENIREYSKFSGAKTAKQKEHSEQMSKMMQKYIDTLECRRKFILDYFQDDTSSCEKPRLNCCDNCRAQVTSGTKFYENYTGLDSTGKYNLAEEIRLYAGVIDNLNGKFGAIMYILTLRGSKNTKVHKVCKSSPYYGKGLQHTEEWWRSVGSIMERDGYLKKTRHSKGTFSYSTIDISYECKALLAKLNANPNMEFRVLPTKEMLTLLKTKKPAVVYETNTWEDTPTTSVSHFKFVNKNKDAEKKVDNTDSPSKPSQKSVKVEEEEEPAHKQYRMALYNKLINLRSDIAHDKNCMPYMVGSNTALMAMSKKRPVSIEDLKAYNYDGFTESKINNFGKIYADFIKQYCVQNPPPDSTDDLNNSMSDAKANYATCTFEEKSEKNVDLKPKAQRISLKEFSIGSDFSDEFKEPEKKISQNDSQTQQSSASLDSTNVRLNMFHSLLMDNINLSGEDWDDWNGEDTATTSSKQSLEPVAKKTKLPQTFKFKAKPEPEVKKVVKKKTKTFDWD